VLTRTVAINGFPSGDHVGWKSRHKKTEIRKVVLERESLIGTARKAASDAPSTSWTVGAPCWSSHRTRPS
jgi:hypothetical protein